MAQGKKSFVLYADMLQSIEHLTNEEKGILFNHLLEYVNDMNPVLTDRLLLTAWKPIELSLKRDLAKFEEVKKKRSNAGKRSAELRAKEHVQQVSTNSTSVESVQQASTNPTHVESVQQASTNSTDNVNDNVNDNVSVNVSVNDISYTNDSIVADASNQKKNIDERILEFKQSLFKFTQTRGGKYPDRMVADFFEYWSEKDKSGKKMRWEKEKTFEAEKRIARWAANEKKFNQKNGKQTSNTFTKLAAEDARKAGIVEMLKRNSQIINGNPGTQPNDAVGHSEENTGYTPYVIVEENRGAGGSPCGNKLTDSGGGFTT